MSYQKVMFIGNLGRDPEMRYLPDGTAVTTFSAAANRKWTKQDGSQGQETTWFRVTTWRKQAEVCAKYLSKGRQVFVEGRLQPDENGNPRTWTGKDGTVHASYEVTAERIIFLGGGDGQKREEDDDFLPRQEEESYDAYY